jgi:hypothetical protein
MWWGSRVTIKMAMQRQGWPGLCHQRYIHRLLHVRAHTAMPCCAVFCCVVLCCVEYLAGECRGKFNVEFRVQGSVCVRRRAEALQLHYLHTHVSLYMRHAFDDNRTSSSTADRQDPDFNTGAANQQQGAQPPPRPQHIASLVRCRHPRLAQCGSSTHAPADKAAPLDPQLAVNKTLRLSALPRRHGWDVCLRLSSWVVGGACMLDCLTDLMALARRGNPVVCPMR